MQRVLHNALPGALKYILILVATIYVLTYLVLAYTRIPYPFELEWMEGGVLDHVNRILAGRKLYVAPSLEFVPFIYTPLYFYVSAIVSSVCGPGLPPLRMVSLMASLGCFLIIYLFVRRETNSAFAGGLSCSLFVATFRECGAWFDLARNDSLFLLFSLSALYVLRFGTHLRSFVISGILFFIAFLTKQTALIIVLPLILYCALTRLRYAMALLCTVGGLVVASTLVLDWVHDGWYSFYVFDLPQQHPIVGDMIIKFWTQDLLGPLAISCAMSGFYLWLQASRRATNNLLFYSLAAVGMVGGAWMSRLHQGGHLNNLFPAYAMICILFGLAIHELLGLVKSRRSASQSLGPGHVFAICIMQYACLLYNPFSLCPSVDDLEAGRRLVARIKGIDGDVFIPCHPYLASAVNKGTFAHQMAILDIFKSGKSDMKEALRDELLLAVGNRRFGAVLVDVDWFPVELEPFYIRQGDVFGQDEVFWPVSGWRIRPEAIFVPTEEDGWER
ncbi:MAG: glycosyltransferase family 39 protein [Phycisphaerae bacterium]